MKAVLILIIILISPLITTAGKDNYINKPILHPDSVKPFKIVNPPETQGTTTKNYNPLKWRENLDNALGFGISTDEKLRLFDHYWDTLRTSYSAYHNLNPINWDSLGYTLRNEIKAGVTRGRFAAILTKLNMAINDSHSGMLDWDIKMSLVYKGLPVVNHNGLFSFGACLTTTLDSNVLVYSSDPNNPFNLAPGDIILGYNNLPLKYLAEEVVDQELPIMLSFGSTNYSSFNLLMVSTAASWNLYDTINILKTNGTIENYSTDLMNGRFFLSDCYEIIPPKGITLPEIRVLFEEKKQAPFGVIEGTSIGYIAVMDCFEYTGDSLYKKIKYLVEDEEVSALIIDLRFNIGGSILTFYKAFAYLNDRSLTNWLTYCDRSDPDNRYAINKWIDYSFAYDIDDITPSFQKPIALLTGPGAISAGDLMNITFQQHPQVKTFGKTTSAAFGGGGTVEMKGSNQYVAHMQSGNFILLEKPDTYLSHLETRVDYPVWLTSENVSQGKDDVIEAALQWINKLTSVDNSDSPDELIAPNPATDAIRINSDDFVRFRIIDINGQNIMEGKLENINLINVNNLNTGVYFLHLYSDTSIKVSKFMKI